MSSEPEHDAPPEWEDEAVRKAKRLRQAKKRSDRTLNVLSRAGVLAWMFILPVLVAGWFAHFALRDSEKKWLILPLLLVGIVIGAAFVRSKVLELLREGDDE